MRLQKYAIRLIPALLFLAACSPARHLPEGQLLLHRNRIEITDAEIEKSELQPLIRQRPNRRILGFFRFHLNAYQLASRGNDNGIKRWLRNTVGEPPVIYDPELSERTRRQFMLYMHSKGYFLAEVRDTVILRNNKALVHYTVRGNQAYHIRNIRLNIRDDHVAGFIGADIENSLLRSGQRYDADILQKERERVTRFMRSQGFFHFSRDFITFQIDSTLGTHQADIEMTVHNPPTVRGSQSDTLSRPRHRRFVINQVQIFPDFNAFSPQADYADTTLFRPGRSDQGPAFVFLHNGPMRIRPQAITSNILLEPGQHYAIGQVEQTHNYLSGLRNFRFINIQFIEARGLENERTDTTGMLNARVQLTRAPTYAYTIEAEGLNSSGNLGMAGNLIFHNRNVFRGAETFNLRLKGALEASGESGSEEIIQRLPFNTLELGAEASIHIPKLFSPIRFERLSKTARPQSTILAGVNFRQRPDYTRFILNLSYGFEWSQDNRKRHALSPLEISSIKLLDDSLLLSKIPANNPLLLSRFKDHLIAGTKYSFVYSTQQLGRDEDFLYFRANLEAAGNLLYLAARQLNVTEDENGRLRLFGIPFAQYVRTDADFRYYKIFDRNNTLAGRVMAGVGVPYGNTTVMPFIKSYYGGGANSVRAWRIYSLGPGGYQDTLDIRFDRYGDIKLEASLEYRFSVYRFIEGALFADAGNVWFMKDIDQFPGGAFRLNNFYRDIALGVGAGIRFDFDFFIVRLDGAFPLHNPALPPGSRWAQRIPGLSRWNFNLGIGYPF